MVFAGMCAQCFSFKTLELEKASLVLSSAEAPGYHGGDFGLGRIR